MYKEAMRPAWVEINLANLDHNIKQIIDKVGSADKIIGVIKADAYGHGALKVTEVLRENGVKTFATATLAEAVKLREHGAREDIIVLGLVPDMYADVPAAYGLTVVCCDSENARAFSAAASAPSAQKPAGACGFAAAESPKCGDSAAPASLQSGCSENAKMQPLPASSCPSPASPAPQPPCACTETEEKPFADSSFDGGCSGGGNASAFAPSASGSARPVSALIALDTGMGRIGYLADDTDAAITDIKKMLALPNFRIIGLFSHMSTADEADKTFSREQEKKYNHFAEALKNAGIDLPMLTFANSAAITEHPSTRFDMVRPGIIMYGCYPSSEVDKSLIDLRPVMSVKANIVHLKEVPAGFSVSYGRSFITERPSKIATIELGYSDGYPRPYSKNAKVIVNGTFAPIAGNICMDQCMIDVTDVPDVKLGDEVIIMGTDGSLTISAEDIASATGTINYEVLCAFGQRLPKVYL